MVFLCVCVCVCGCVLAGSAAWENRRKQSQIMIIKVTCSFFAHQQYQTRPSVTHDWTIKVFTERERDIHKILGTQWIVEVFVSDQKRKLLSKRDFFIGVDMTTFDIFFSAYLRSFHSTAQHQVAEWMCVRACASC